MSEKDGKTEKPTPKKLKDARKRGEIAKSQEFNSAFTYIMFLMFAIALSTHALQYGYVYLKRELAVDYDVGGLENNLNDIGMKAILSIFILAGPFLGIAFIGALIANIIQTGLLFSTEALKFKMSRLNPVSGLKNMFSKKALFTLIKNILKMILIGYVCYISFEKSGYYIINSAAVGTEKLYFLILELVKDISTNLAILLFLLGMVDFIYQKYDYKKNLNMTKQEIKDEYKESEGDPYIKSLRRQKYKQFSKQMLKDVESATVIITNPTHLAIAVRYDTERDQVPVVVAKGADYVAEKIREAASKNNIPIMENKPVARAMYRSVEVGQPIPLDFYEAIAEMIALIYQINESNKRKI